MTEKTKLSDDLNTLVNQEQASDIAMHEIMKEVQKFSELIKNVAIYYQFAKPYEKEKITRIIFSELFITQDMLQFKVKKGFEAFENRFVALCEHLLSYFELLPNNVEMQVNMEDFIESYRLSESTVYRSNLDFIRI